MPMNNPPTAGRSSVWASAQQTARTQRAGRYLDESRTHPGKMLPAIAAQAISTYTKPSDLIVDPMCGIGTSLVEAIHQGRDAIGIEYEPDSADLARRNIRHAKANGATGQAIVTTGDARDMLPILAGQLIRDGRHAALVLTSPPYGPSLHGQVNSLVGDAIYKSYDRYSTDPGNLAHQTRDDLFIALTQILHASSGLLKPGGIVAVTARPYRRKGFLVDIPGDVRRAGIAAGLIPAERIVCLLARVDGQRLVPRASFFQLDTVRKARAAGNPLAVIAHEDLLIFRKGRSASGTVITAGPPSG